jgi:hypothetical protein
MITDELRKQIADHVVSLINHASASAKVGLGGNSTSPAALDIDVPSGASINQLSAAKSNDTTFQVFVEVLGSQLTGLTIREMGVFDSSSNMLARISFDGISSVASTEKLQLFLTMEVR